MSRAPPVLALLALAAPARADAQDRVTAAALRDWPPQYGVDARGHPSGFAIDLFDAVAEEAGIEVEYRFYDQFSEAIADLEAGRVDVIPNFGVTEGRQHVVLFTRPVETAEIVLWVRTSSRDVDGLDDLEGRPVATVRSNVGEDLVSAASAVRYDDPRTALFDLLAGEVDGVVYPEAVFGSLAVQAGVADRLRAVDPPLLEIRRAIGVRGDAPELRDRLDAALAAVHASGEYEAVYQRWYATPPPWWTDPRVARGVVAALGLVVVAALAGRLRLQRRLLDEATARAEAESQRRRSERRLEDVMAAAPDGVFFADPQGVYVDVNPAGCTLLGRPREDIVGRTMREFIAPESLAERPIDLGRVRVAAPIVVERTLLRADGSPVAVEISGSRLDDGTILGIVRDLTPRKQAEAALNERETQLQQAQRLEAIGRLAGAVAHDFNNLLTIIVNDADFLRREPDPARRERAEEILQAAQRAAELTRQLLAFGRRQVLQPVPTDPAEALQRMQKMLGRVLPPVVRLTVVGVPGRAAIVVDPGQLDQVLMNLVLNARDALEPGGGDITVKTDLVPLEGDAAARVGAPPGLYAIIEVADTGHGMDEATLAKVFEPFFTTKAPGRGTGLGLATVQGIVRQSGGWVDVRSAVGNGTTFRLGFPATETAVLAPVAAPTSDPKLQGSGRVLVVEDEPIVRRMTVRALVAAGYEVVEAGGADEALRVADGLDLLAVITDVVMPGTSGPELVDRLGRPGLPVLFVSGFSDMALDAALAPPNRAFLGKPFTPDQLRKALARLIEGTSG